MVFENGLIRVSRVPKPQAFNLPLPLNMVVGKGISHE